MKFEVFKYTDYKAYLNDRLNQKNIRGLRTKVSSHIGCQASYLSQVLYGKPHLTLEQASRLNEFFFHDNLESRYFILSVEYARAGSKDLKNFFETQLKELQSSRFDLKKRLVNTEEVPSEIAHQYYSAWFYSAIHMALSIPGYEEPDIIAQKLHLPREMVVGVIRFLEHSGLVEKKNGRYEYTKTRIHLKRDSDFVRRHHVNWRSQALQSAEKNLPQDLHYSGVFAFSKNDYPKVKEIFVKALEEARQVIGPSKEEELYAITFDVFKV